MLIKIENENTESGDIGGGVKKREYHFPLPFIYCLFVHLKHLSISISVLSTHNTVYTPALQHMLLWSYFVLCGCLYTFTYRIFAAELFYMSIRKRFHTHIQNAQQHHYQTVKTKRSYSTKLCRCPLHCFSNRFIAKKHKTTTAQSKKWQQ